MLNQTISLVVPVYNEAEIIAETVAVFDDALRSICRDYEIIIVDDGSVDETPGILQRLCSQHVRLKIMHNSANIGSGASLWRGFQQAGKDLVVSNFADRPFDVTELGRIIPSVDFSATDFVVVVRQDRSANTPYRKITSLTNYWLIRCLFRIEISDFQFVQIYRRDILKGVRIDSQETFVPPELMIRLIQKGYRYQEVVSSFYRRPGGQPKCGHPGKIMKSIFDILKFWISWEILGKKDGGER